jgi:hypothetical protein
MICIQYRLMSSSSFVSASRFNLVPSFSILGSALVNVFIFYNIQQAKLLRAKVVMKLRLIVSSVMRRLPHMQLTPIQFNLFLRFMIYINESLRNCHTDIFAWVEPISSWSRFYVQCVIYNKTNAKSLLLIRIIVV